MQNYPSEPAMELQVPADLATVAADELDRLAKESARQFARKDKLETSQIRNVYSGIVKIRMAYYRGDRKTDELVDELIMLRPRIAYAAGRKDSVKRFGRFLLQAIDGVKDSSDRGKALKNFFWLAEAIVAYHKFHGGRE